MTAHFPGLVQTLQLKQIVVLNYPSGAPESTHGVKLVLWVHFSHLRIQMSMNMREYLNSHLDKGKQRNIAWSEVLNFRVKECKWPFYNEHNSYSKTNVKFPTPAVELLSINATSVVLRSPPLLCKPLRNICVTNDHGYVPFVVSNTRSFITYHRVCNQNNTTVATSVAGTPTLPEHLSPPPVFSGFRIARSLVFCVVLFLLSIVLSVLRFADCDYRFVIFKLFLQGNK